MTDRFKHSWDVCGMCGVMVRCGTCSNNCCNGGYGELPDGLECPDCKSAYELQDQALKDGTAPKPWELHLQHPLELPWAEAGVVPVEF